MPRILNLGSLNIDYVYRMDRVVEPGETRASADFSRCAGGKGLNQSIAMARAGTEVCHAGYLGQEAEQLRDPLAAERVDTTRLRTVGLRAGHAIIQVDAAGRNAIVPHGGANLGLQAAQFPDRFEGFGADDWFLAQNETSGASPGLSRPLVHAG